jgi:hypothetical protein
MSLSEAAEMAFSSLDAYIQRQIISVAELTEVPTLQEAVRKGNLDLEKNLEEVRKSIPLMEQEWASLDRHSPKLTAILDCPASDFLRNYVSVGKNYRQVLVTDFLGRVVAATGKTSGYHHANSTWWKETYGDGRIGSVYIGDIVYDPSSKSYRMELAQPFMEPGGGVMGVIKVVLDPQDIYSLIGSYRAGPMAAAMLLQANGKVIAAPGSTLIEQRSHPAMEDILAAIEKGRPYLVGKTSPQTIYGLTERKFQERYQHLNWIVLTAGAVEDILRPLQEHRLYFVALVALVFIFSFVATLLLSKVESAPPVEQDPHLENL